MPECTLCNPALAQLPGTPVVTAHDLDRAKRALDFADRPGNNPVCRSHHRRIQFATARDADKAGVTVEPVWTAPAAEFVPAPGEIGYDQSRVAHLSARSPGTVRTVFKHLGQDVKAGELLALVDAAEVGRAKAEVLQAFAGHQLKAETLASVKQSGGAVSGARLREVEAALIEAEIRLSAGCQSLTNLGLPFDEAELRTLTADQLRAKLHFLGIPAVVAKSLDAKSATTNLLPLVTPMDGVIVSREMAAGEVVDVARILFEVVDTRSLWLTLDLKGEDARRVNAGHPVRFKPDNGREELLGKITWRSSHADPKTRTVKVRADLADPDRKLVANTFGSGRVVLREEAEVVSVPNDAVHWEGCCHVVFVRDRDYLKAGSPKVFHVRKVRLGARDARNTEVIAGVRPGELVATGGSGLLLTELLRADLGEGCACCHPK
ncbi:efflux RND transporter periplasmic adaptor subunit [Gemmata sp.]|uniref:efflux RND transporter periplasmic adaptor subunit n=1 Tax=Gemmata sp. TaxID=1914242 RepID=UPI003F6FF2CA